MPKTVSLASVQSRLDAAKQALERNRAEQERLAQEVIALEKEQERLKTLAQLVEEFGETDETDEEQQVDAAAENTDTTRMIDEGNPNVGPEEPPEPEESIGPTAPEMAARALREIGQPTSTWPLIRQMQKMGFKSNAERIYLSVFGTLNRVSKRPNSEVVKVKGNWALREWGLDDTERNQPAINADDL
jgi:hypothetical protein